MTKKSKVLLLSVVAIVMSFISVNRLGSYLYYFTYVLYKISYSLLIIAAYITFIKKKNIELSLGVSFLCTVLQMSFVLSKLYVGIDETSLIFLVISLLITGGIYKRYTMEKNNVC